MGKQRNLIEEIKSIKARTDFNSRYEFTSRLNDIEKALKGFGEYGGVYSSELLKYIPISTVACFEAFFNSIVKDLIDFGKPFSENIGAYNQAKNVKFDFNVISEIQAKSLTIGEFVAHLLPYNSLEDVASNISILIGADFLTGLKLFNKKSIYEHVNEQTRQFISNAGEIFDSVKKTYELRHILCHEFATNVYNR